MDRRIGQGLRALVALVLLWPVAARPAQSVKTIEGVVVRAEDGTPVSGARVILDHPPVTRSGGWQDKERNDRQRLSSAPTVITDPSGRFLLNGLVGDFPVYTVLRVRANGFVPTNLGIGNNEVKPGAPLTIKLGRTGAINGQVKDPAGYPIPNMTVRLIQQDYQSYAIGISMIVDRALTNDRGEYRIYGIEPGRYRVVAGNAQPAYLAADSNGSEKSFETNNALGQSFYPGVATIEEAGVVVVRSGGELNVDFTMAPQTLHRIRGRVVDSRTGRAPASPSITVVEKSNLVGNDATMMDTSLARLGSGSIYDRTTGLLDLHDLAPGTYIITAKMVDRPAGVPRDAEPTRSSGSATVTISNADVNDVTITLQPHGSVGGRIRVEGEGRESIRADRFSVELRPVLAIDESWAASNYADADGSFGIEDVPHDAYRVVVNNGYQQDAYVRAIRHNGVDVLGVPLNLTGVTFGTLDVTINPAAGQLSGTCMDSRGKPAVSALVVLVPDRNRENPDLFKSKRTDDDGKFAIRGTAPGSYRAYCWEDLGSSPWFDPSFLAQWESRGRTVLLTERARETINLQVLPK